MTLEKARNILQVQVDFDGFYYRHGTKLSLADGFSEHGHPVADKSITEFKLGEVLQFSSEYTFNLPA